MNSHFSVAAVYGFFPIADPAAVRDVLQDCCRSAAVRGTLLLAPEGINGTIAGEADGLASVLDAIRALPGATGLEIKLSGADAMPFHRLKVRCKREIVTMGVADLDLGKRGQHVPPADWNDLIARPDTIIIDTRNAYEVAMGSFEGAIDPGTEAFGDFPAWFRANREALFAGRPDAPVAMFCTGGIRCEKASAFLRAEGVAQVHHLHGGILKYLETVSPENSRWQGECFVFDERVGLTHGLEQGTHVLCRGCRMPVSTADQASPLYISGVQCVHCAGTRDAQAQAGYAERHRQALLAEARGTTHIGAAPDVRPGHPPDYTS
ncbi:UPF0176 protein [Polymorphobacter multimanifer]|uniref:tRNA uridine(34) hydroxylase n=1 Tax=Polymorphobacter multimanifer TaxID=1070431 RepID=A0A841LBJ6_9SPHN|nr:rhodanese-related sulfurtransferase [Polymorphobacter multimanifer]MBB6229051.1 UPF0176 protein [Polymorphobacter multimanifer]GGI77080.1 UPF0176 protein [Polymorphobacter multimanifer]